MSETLIVQAEMAEIARVALWAEAYAERLALPARTAFALQLCFEEAVSNIVRHGFSGQQDEAGLNRDVRLHLRHTPHDVTMTIEDFAAAFDPLSVPLPAAPASIADAQIGGQGINLMRRFAQDIAYERRDGMNRLTLRFDLPQPAGA